MLIVVPDYRLWFNCPQLGALYIAASAKNAGENVSILDFKTSKNPIERLNAELEKHDILAITSNVSHAFSAVKIASHVRKKFPNKKIIWGGPYPSVEYEKLIPNLADIVVIGEGEEQIAQILSGVPLDKIQSIAYYEGSRMKVNPRIKFNENLDALPFPAWELLDIFKYNFPGKQPGYLMQTQRGCPFNCINCTTFIHGTKYRTRSVQNVVNEIEWLVKSMHAKEIHFWDDNFTLNPERVMAICDEILSRKLKVRMTLPNGIRADIDNTKMFKLMRKAGFYYVNLAIESAEQSVVDNLGKKLNLQKARETLKSLHSYGFRIGLLFMMGLPFDTKESISKTIQFAAESPAHHAHFFVVTPFPGTKLYDMVKEKGGHVWDYRDSYISFDSHEERFINPNLSRTDLMRMHKFAYRKFYTPSRIIKLLSKMITEKSIFVDIRFLLKCGIPILFKGTRFND